MNKTLYIKDTKGKIREWSIKVVPSEDGGYDIITTAGRQDGQKIITIVNIADGKSIGRSNETTAYQQAVRDALTEFNYNIKHGYVEDIDEIKSKGETATIPAPMKGYGYHPLGKFKLKTLDQHKIRDVLVGISWKVDGWRFRIGVNENIIIFYTASGDIVPSFPLIEAAVRQKYDELGLKGTHILDGEMYNHDLTFNDIQTACSTKVHITPEKAVLRNKMKFYIFDYVSDDYYPTRHAFANQFVDTVNIMEVPIIYIKANEAEIDRLFYEFLELGYEGVIIRRLNGPYEHKKGKQIIKYKPKIDAEYQVVGFKKSITGDTLGAFELSMPDGRVFKSDTKEKLGSDESKQELWNKRESLIGKWVTVEFFKYTEDGIPFHPKAKAFRKGVSTD